jgi:hypothetical protein
VVHLLGRHSLNALNIALPADAFPEEITLSTLLKSVQYQKYKFD